MYFFYILIDANDHCNGFAAGDHERLGRPVNRRRSTGDNGLQRRPWLGEVPAEPGGSYAGRAE
jgi:hypothetical protein